MCYNSYEPFLHLALSLARDNLSASDFDPADIYQSILLIV